MVVKYLKLHTCSDRAFRKPFALEPDHPPILSPGPLSDSASSISRMMEILLDRFAEDSSTILSRALLRMSSAGDGGCHGTPKRSEFEENDSVGTSS